ncbi:MAG: roadblock/LC7 domain-containing protein [Deltaproteobacteria bacterium]|nr:roadblock/LC7 domain-containing protein [Deltaproteobacteria bacterium]
MDFLQILKELVDPTKGSMAATIMGLDGIALQDYKREGVECDLEALGVEYGKVMGEICKASNILNLGDVEEFIISSEGLSVILRLATPEYFIALVISKGGNTGQGKFYLRRAAGRTRTALDL